MPFCPKCKTEYQQGYTICSDCRVELADELSGNEETDQKPNEYNEAFLCTAIDTNQANQIESVLYRKATGWD